MTINTKFNVGEHVCFLEGGSIFRRPVHKITIEIVEVPWGTSPVAPLIVYYFILDPNIQHCKQTYKYENEIAATKEDLVNALQVL